MRGEARWLIALSFLAPAAAIGQDPCVGTLPTHGVACCIDEVQIKLTNNSAPLPYPAALGDAATDWNVGCGMGGENIPIVSTLPNANNRVLPITFVDGSSGSTACGLWTGPFPGTITLWRTAIENGQTKQCASNVEVLTDNLAHEIGHYMGLGHPGSGCTSNYIMQACCGDRSIKSAECSKANELMKTFEERGGTPIVVNLAIGPYQLSGPADPVAFDLDTDGVPELTTWTAAGSNAGFLFRDLNRDGIVNDGSELFGSHTLLADGTEASNGFEALRDLDSNANGLTDSGDAVWPELRLWIDGNHDGLTQPEEIKTLAVAGVVSISLDYRGSRRFDRYGNLFRLVSTITLNRWGGTVDRPVYDIYFVRLSE